MTRPTAIIAEDETPQREELRALLAELWPELSIVAECEDGLTALEAFGRVRAERVLARGGIDLNVPSLTGTSRHYDTAASLDEETMNARIWLGFHFRRAMTDGNRLGHDVSNYGITHYFEPTG